MQHVFSSGFVRVYEKWKWDDDDDDAIHIHRFEKQKKTVIVTSYDRYILLIIKDKRDELNV